MTLGRLGDEYKDITIIRGTNRNQDVIPAILEFVHTNHTAAYDSLVSEYPKLQDMENLDPTDPLWDSEDAMFYLEALYDALDDIAPRGYYFGSHPGSTSDIGFWLIEEE